MAPKDQTPAADTELKNSVETMHSDKMNSKKAGQSTQQYLDVEEIRDGVMVLRDGGMRALVMVSSMNFALKSTEEQEAIIYAYQSFLNSLEFPIQIAVQSRQLDIDSYLETLRKMESEQSSELLRIQTAEYIEYVMQLVELSHIMSKSFYIVVPFSPAEGKKESWVDKVFSPTKEVVHKETDFKRYRDLLMQRVDHIATGLQGVGLRIALLETQELIELLYNTYNPATFQQETLSDVNKLDLSTGDFIPEAEKQAAPEE